MTLRVETSESLPVASLGDIVKVRRRCGTLARELGFRSSDQTRVMTAASELARNAVVHGGGGRAHIEVLRDVDGRHGVRLTVEDEGPGIEDVERALQDGFSSGEGLGLGLGGARRLADELEVQSEAGHGTRVVLTKWCR